MNAASLWTVIVAVCSLVPAIVSAVRAGTIKQGAYDEVISALSAEFDKRISAMEKAEPTGTEDDDPNARP